MFPSKLANKKIQDKMKTKDNQDCPGKPDACKERCVEEKHMG